MDPMRRTGQGGSESTYEVGHQTGMTIHFLENHSGCLVWI